MEREPNYGNARTQQHAERQEHREALCREADMKRTPAGVPRPARLVLVRRGAATQRMYVTYALHMLYVL